MIWITLATFVGIPLVLFWDWIGRGAAGQTGDRRLAGWRFRQLANALDQLDL